MVGLMLIVEQLHMYFTVYSNIAIALIAIFYCVTINETQKEQIDTFDSSPFDPCK